MLSQLLTLASISMGGDTVGTLRSRVTIASGSLYREAAVLYMQTWWRGRQAVLRMRQLQTEYRYRCEYATKIQMAFRRHCVPGWRGIRYRGIVRAIRTQCRLPTPDVVLAELSQCIFALFEKAQHELRQIHTPLDVAETHKEIGKMLLDETL